MSGIAARSNNNMSLALLCISANDAGCWSRIWDLQHRSIKSTFLWLMHSAHRVQEVINLLMWQPYGDDFIRRQSWCDLRVSQVFDGSRGVKLPFPGASSWMKTRVLQSSCPLLAYSSPADMKLCCVTSCCQAEWM